MQFDDIGFDDTRFTVGDIAEQEIIEILTQSGYQNAHKNPSRKLAEMKKWDISYEDNGQTVWIECKNDVKAAESGSVAIEFEYDGNPSGLDATESYFWVHRIGTEYWLIETELLRTLIYEPKRSKGPSIRFNVGAERNCSIYLLKVDVFKQHASILGYSADHKGQDNV